MDFNALTKMIPGADTYMKTAKDLGAVSGPVERQGGADVVILQVGKPGSGMVGKFSGCCLILSAKPGENRQKIF